MEQSQPSALPRKATKKQKPKEPIFDFNSEKILDALAVGMRDDTRLMVFEGTIRSAKTTTAIELLHLRVKYKMTAKYAMIACEDNDAVRMNILDSKLGLMTIQPEQYALEKDKIGGYFVKVVGTDKEIIICGYADASRWKKILGKDIEVILIDEMNIANEQFVDESLGRQGATEQPFTIGTLNGDDPSLPVYQNIINKCLIIGECPASIRVEMDAVEYKKRGYYYFHWTFEDNPGLDDKMKFRLRHTYPVGSYYHKTRILGERGKWGTMIYADYMSADLIVNPFIFDGYTGTFVLDPKFGISRFVIGIDIAEARASNVFALVGFDHSYSRCMLVDLVVFKSNEGGMKTGYAKKTAMLKAFVAKHADKYIECISVDSAEGNYIKDLQGERLGASVNNHTGIQVIPSYKATIKDRIDLNIILFSKRRFVFSNGYLNGPIPHDSTLQAFQAYQNAIWVKDKEGKEREDNNLPMNDIMDAVEYAETVHMKALSFAAKRTEVC